MTRTTTYAQELTALEDRLDAMADAGTYPAFAATCERLLGVGPTGAAEDDPWHLAAFLDEWEESRAEARA